MVEVDHDDVPVVDENDVRMEVSGDVGGVVKLLMWCRTGGYHCVGNRCDVVY